MSRFLVLFLTLGVSGMIGQAGFFGPVSTRLQAGDFAPDIVFTEILNAAAPVPPATWSPANLSGRLTVLTLLPVVSHNLQAIGRWNALVKQFRDKQVQFVWVAGEYQPPLRPWLEKHPVQGWLFLDPLGATGHAYGMELPSALLIGGDRRILGFDRSMIPEAHTIQAALDGRIGALEAAAPRMPRAEDHRPDFPPSYTVHIAPSKSRGAGEYSSDDYWSFRDLDLKDILMNLYGTARVRIELPVALDWGQRYDVAAVLPAPESKESISQRIARGIEDYFHVAVAREDRLQDVYVVSTHGGKPPAVQADPDEAGGFSSTSSVQWQVAVRGNSGKPPEPPFALGLESIRGVSIDGTADEFCRALESQLNRPVVNETHLEGEFAFHAEAGRTPENDFLERLRDQSHVTIATAQRRVTMVVVKPR